MEEKDINFLNNIKNKFSTLKDDEILIGKKEMIEIPIEWIFTENLDRAIIETAMTNLLRKNNPNYEKATLYKKEDPNKIDKISIEIKDDKIDLVIKGRDNWTKAIISSNPKSNSRILKIGEEEFFQEISNVLDEEKINQICEQLDLDKEQRENMQTIFSSSIGSKVTQNGIKQAMLEATENLSNYYRYLIHEKRQSKTYNLIINQKQGNNEGKTRIEKTTSNETRKSPIYPFMQRAQILNDMNPDYNIIVDVIDSNGNVNRCAYNSYIYENVNNSDGTLFVCEPLEGMHTTRMMYTDADKIKQLREKYGNNEYMPKVVANILEMPYGEFTRSENSIALNHNDMESFKERLQYIIQGKNSENVSYYNKKIADKLYGRNREENTHKNPKVSESDIINVVGSVTKTTYGLVNNVLKNEQQKKKEKGEK